VRRPSLLKGDQSAQADLRPSLCRADARQIIGSQGRGLTVRVKITFFDRAIAVRVPQLLQQTGDSQTANDGGILIRSDTLFPVLDAYLRALQVADPVNFPFGDLLAPGPKTGVVLEPPAHAQVPGWRWNLSSLLKEPRDATFSATDPESIIAAREILKAESRLDPSQADAMVDIMTRSIALLQGPPGTGKSFTGVELIRVLLANKCGPILLIAYTNQALDHLLRSVFDGHVTKRIVRLGGRSADEVVSNLSLESLEMTDQSSLLGGCGLASLFLQHDRENADVAPLLPLLSAIHALFVRRTAGSSNFSAR